MKKLNLILASTRKMGIGYQNDLPWPRLKQDMRFFKNVTKGQKGDKNCLIMGFNTFKSIGKGLPGRLNLVVTSKKREQLREYEGEEVRFFGSLDEAYEFSKNVQGENFVIGGGKIFDQVMMQKDEVNRLYWTRVQNDFQTDCYVDKDKFQNLTKQLGNELVSKTILDSGVHYDYVVYGNHNEKNRGFEDVHEEYQYLNLLRKIIKKGHKRDDRTGMGTIGLFGESMRFDLGQSFPLLTTKKVFTRGIIEELLWFIRGQTDAKILRDKKVHIWDGNGNREFLDQRGLQHYREWDLGPVYGFQWRHFGAQYESCDSNYDHQGVDQLQQVMTSLKNDPYSRRHLVCAWNPSDLKKMALPPCHVLFQFYVDDKKRLSCSLYQRSCDVGLGLPFNIASYSLLVCMMADHLGLERGEFVHFIGDTHIYQNHVEMLKIQSQRAPKPFPILELTNHHDSLEAYQVDDFKLSNYHPHPKIQMEMSAQLIQLKMPPIKSNEIFIRNQYQNYKYMEQTYNATVVEILGRTGSRGGITQARVQIETTGGSRTLTRNIKGPVKVGDQLILLEAEREARRMR